MKDVNTALLLGGQWQPQLSQQLAGALADGGDGTERRTIDETHARARRVEIRGRERAVRHLRLEPAKVERRRRGLHVPDRAALTVYGLPLAVRAVDLVVDLILLFRPQGDAHLRVAVDHQRLRPHRVA